MKPTFKMLVKDGRVVILGWETQGVLFGPQWRAIANFPHTGQNELRCKTITRLLNECNEHSQNQEHNG